MSRPGYTALSMTVTDPDHARLDQIAGIQSFNAFLRELVNDWLEAHGHPLLEEATRAQGRPRKVSKK